MVVLSRTELGESAELAELVVLAEQGFHINTHDLTTSGKVVAKLVLSVTYQGISNSLIGLYVLLSFSA